ncbi:YebC/PmpR family DNA-binding transcriptional regulator [Culicoidibacter larvae]|uniref:Probable transcriptional regulatory protein FEZ08_04280 n=1 Tax=Culicoidibacter larvae TaxID=2579976 RepID=A0A5R8QE16_9FIRM|nr:YebC/PmpR family DNA-binding transcriptional regulator [Culicoidibacter larvae]TLG75270.1 YebC/PmpR family DNA-binding transcriptional regulator [Culicoidibacter larvae]
MGRKWNNIKEGKAKKDASRTRIYSKFGRVIYMAAKNGSTDPEANHELKVAIERAKTYEVPRDIIERAIEKAKSNVVENFDSVRYEGYGPGGSAIIVDALTDNVNRTVAEVRTAFNKNGGNMGVSGAVSYLFEPTAIIGITASDSDAVLELLLEADCDVRDIVQEDETMIIQAAPEDLHKVQVALSGAGYDEFAVAELTMLPNTEIELSSEHAEQFEKLIDALNEVDDVSDVYHNADVETE